eukprot:augustus_masked-scaffold_2-processed-gene-17.44-mRNA-1 protein AED:1.00 eAED:1.00 QI:0/0/0/0/1/1/3/0/418
MPKSTTALIQEILTIYDEEKAKSTLNNAKFYTEKFSSPKLICKNCGKEAPVFLDSKAGDTVCTNCGFVLNEREVVETQFGRGAGGYSTGSTDSDKLDLVTGTKHKEHGRTRKYYKTVLKRKANEIIDGLVGEDDQVSELAKAMFEKYSATLEQLDTYQWGNVGEWASSSELWLSKFDSSNSVFAHIQNAFKQFVLHTTTDVKEVYYFGYSAGAQLVNRQLLLDSTGFIEDTMTKVCTASSFTFTFPTQTTMFGTTYPYSMAPTTLTNLTKKLFNSSEVKAILRGLIKKMQQIPVMLTVGDGDVKHANETDEAYLQGRNRIVRLENYYSYLLGLYEAEQSFSELSEDNSSSGTTNFNFKWRKDVFEDSGHAADRMWKPCWNYMFNTQLTLSQNSAASTWSLLFPHLCCFLLFVICFIRT